MIHIEEEYNFTFTHHPNRAFELLSPSGQYRSLLEKWGLLSDTALLCFSFDQMYHRGMRDGFLKSFFQSEVVREHFALSNGNGALSVPIPYVSRLTSAQIEAVDLRCTQTTLDMFSKLVNNEIVRESLDQDNDDSDIEEKNKDGARVETDAPESDRPVKVERVCQMMDVYLPCGVTVADELRGVFMLGEESANCYVFSEEEKNEFLYHVMWRLCAGGALNQWEDNFVVYKDATRTLYKDLVCVGRDDGAESEEDQLKVLSHVVQVHKIDGIPLFPRDDRTYPSNGNYLYLIINPSRKEVVVWYHGFWSTF